jgi:hypothetical protein
MLSEDQPAMNADTVGTAGVKRGYFHVVLCLIAPTDHFTQAVELEEVTWVEVEVQVASSTAHPTQSDLVSHTQCQWGQEDRVSITAMAPTARTQFSGHLMLTPSGRLVVLAGCPATPAEMGLSRQAGQGEARRNAGILRPAPHPATPVARVFLVGGASRGILLQLV